jgi:hypothetical protein
MRIAILLASLIWLMPGTAFADYFQFFNAATPYFIPNAMVSLNGQTIGYTDAYGRIKIDLAPGNYQVQIEFKNGLKTVQLHIDGKTNLKKVEAH